MQIYILQDYKFEFDDMVKYETYSCDFYDGIIFHTKSGKYDIVNNPLLGYRLLLNTEEGWKDVPFNEKTFYMLPEEIRTFVNPV